MRSFLLAALLTVVLAPATMAQIGDTGGDPGCGLTVPCDSDFPPDDQAGTTKIVSCTNSFGCPLCAVNFNTNEVICEAKQGQWGHCTCRPIGWVKDRWGLRPSCQVEGSCTVR
jgi:hypothetical protein